VTIAGRFDQGQAQECVVYGDVDSIMSAFKRNTYTSVAVMLQSSADYDAFSRPRSRPTQPCTSKPCTKGAVVEDEFKQLNAIFSSSPISSGRSWRSARRWGCQFPYCHRRFATPRELATVRAIGFRSRSHRVSSWSVAPAGSCRSATRERVGHGLLFNGLGPPLGYSIKLAVTPSLVQPASMGLGDGAVGRSAARLRAARVPVTTALRPSEGGAVLTLASSVASQQISAVTSGSSPTLVGVNGYLGPAGGCYGIDTGGRCP